MKVEDMFREEPEPKDMSDPDVQEDLFEYLHGENTKPEDLPDAQDRKRYKQWLIKNGHKVPE